MWEVLVLDLIISLFAGKMLLEDFQTFIASEIDREDDDDEGLSPSHRPRRRRHAR